MIDHLMIQRTHLLKCKIINNGYSIKDKYLLEPPNNRPVHCVVHNIWYKNYSVTQQCFPMIIKMIIIYIPARQTGPKKLGECQVFPPPSSPFLASSMAFHHLVSTICLTWPSEIRIRSWTLLCDYRKQRPQNK